jgi:hypothetical protein
MQSHRTQIEVTSNIEKRALKNKKNGQNQLDNLTLLLKDDNPRRRYRAKEIDKTSDQSG